MPNVELDRRSHPPNPVATATVQPNELFAQLNSPVAIETKLHAARRHQAAVTVTASDEELVELTQLARRPAGDGHRRRSAVL